MTSSDASALRSRGKASIYDVAALAGVSHQTVSRVINDRPNIRESTRTRVLAAMEEMQYAPSSAARALATNRSRRIGVLVDSPVQYGPSSTMRGLEEAARAAGYMVSASTVGAGPSLGMGDALAYLRGQDVDALCVIAPRYSTLLDVHAVSRDLPIVLVKADPEDEVLTVAVDQYAGAVHAVDHLLELGHRRILHLAGPDDWADARVRARAYTERLAAGGLQVPDQIVGDWTSDFGFRVGADPSTIPADVTAIFAGNDQMALGLIHGLATRGVAVPEDISVIGFDDLPDARHFLPPLTTVRQDFHALGTLAMTSLLAALEDGSAPDYGMIEPELIVRDSTAAPRH